MWIKIDEQVVFLESFYIGKTEFNINVDLEGEEYICEDTKTVKKINRGYGRNIVTKYADYIKMISSDRKGWVPSGRDSLSKRWELKIELIQSKKPDILFIVHKNGVIKVEEAYRIEKYKAKLMTALGSVLEL